MLRYRRYRVFLLFTAVVVFLIYTFATPTRWEETSHAVDQVKQQLGLQQTTGSKSNSRKQQQEPLSPPDIRPPSQQIPPPPVDPIPKPVQDLPPPKVDTSKAPNRQSAEIFTDADDDGRQHVVAGPPPTELVDSVIAESGEGRKEEDPLPSDAVLIRWELPEEHFPVSETIQLPTGTPKPIPRIQYDFTQESSTERKERLEKLDVIKRAFLHSWNGYKENAWGKDEVTPVTGNFKNPFNGWGATLVDSLDTLWIMGLKKEFEEAVAQVAKIDFQTSRRGDIPLFETVIRYLGGLIGAYDVSGGTYKVLLEKAVELGEILIGAFDTPNRMPITFYQWKPAFTSQPHRASNRVVLAELGSLAVEFTRLSQITKEPKYYDAIARITDALQEWQNHTRVPGLWPIHVDASGCDRVQSYRTAITHSDNNDTLTSDLEAADTTDQGSKADDSSSTVSIPNPGTNAARVDESVDSSSNVSPTGEAASDRSKGPGTTADNVEKHRIQGWDENHPETSTTKKSEKDAEEEPKMEPIVLPPPVTFEVKDAPKDRHEVKRKRQLGKPEIDWENEQSPSTAAATTTTKKKAYSSPTPLPECLPHGLGSTSAYGNEEFTLGSMADSTYEYFPKEYIMLGGLVDQYREMYETAIDVAKSKLLFRVMIPDEDRQIYVSGAYKVSVPLTDDEPLKGTLTTSGSHLTCFVGGMFGLGAKVFDRPEDLEIAKKLTDGCVWAYESTTTGIMPENFMAIPCDFDHCEWNETLWWDLLDPNSAWREESYERQLETYNRAVAARESAEAEEAAQAARAAELAAAEGNRSFDEPDSPVAIQTAPPSKPIGAVDNPLQKRQVGSIGAEPPPRASPDPNAQSAGSPEAPSTPTYKGPPSRTNKVSRPPIWAPKKPLTHEEFVRARIEDDGMPAGVSYIADRRYILRPEALESVFYMYRITGAAYWRAKGWAMVAAILRHTEATFGHAAIDDVTKAEPRPLDSMESFWLAETLKYAWLLFEEESRWSLDHWVLNTEAHLLRRPDAPRE